VDPARTAAYVGSYVDLGVAVVDIRDRTNPVVVDILTTDYVGADDRVASSDSADVDINGDLLAVGSQTLSEGAFAGVRLDDIPDVFHPRLRALVPPGG